MSHRHFVALVVLAACSSQGPQAHAPAEGSSGAATQAGAAAQPLPARLPVAENVVLVTIDTLRADALAAHGGPAPTPVLDALAREGWDFTRCFSASMLTNPSHASMMTSLYPRDHGVYDNESGVHAEARTLAAALERQSLRTLAIIGFPHLNPEVSGLGAGFEKVVRATRQERRAAETTRAALAALDESAPSGRFFMWVHYTDPHAPYEPPADLALPALAQATPMASAVRAAPGFQRSNPWFRDVLRRERFVETLAARYFAEVSAADRALGELLAGLEARGRLATTAVVVTADHGENLGEHELYFHHGGLYREAVHVPLIVKAPGLTPRRIEGLVETVDIAPTVLELAGAARWEPMRGTSLVDVAAGRAPARAVAFSEHMGAQLAAVRTAEASLIVHRKTSGQFPSYPITAGRVELYDLRNDPGELEALDPDAGAGPELRAQLSRLLSEGTEMTAKRAAHVDRESLRALGYIE